MLPAQKQVTPLSPITHVRFGQKQTLSQSAQMAARADFRVVTVPIAEIVSIAR